MNESIISSTVIVPTAIIASYRLNEKAFTRRDQRHLVIMKSILEWPAANPISRSRSPRKALVYARSHRAREIESEGKIKRKKARMK